MGRKTNSISFFDNGGGLVTSTSPFQIANNEASIANNIIFRKYGNTAFFSKRKALHQVNIDSLTSAPVAIWNSVTTSTSDYLLNCLTKDGYFGTISKYIGTAQETTGVTKFDSSIVPSIVQFKTVVSTTSTDALFGNFKEIVDEPSLTSTDWTAINGATLSNVDTELRMVKTGGTAGTFYGGSRSFGGGYDMSIDTVDVAVYGKVSAGTMTVRITFASGVDLTTNTKYWEYNTTGSVKQIDITGTPTGSSGTLNPELVSGIKIEIKSTNNADVNLVIPSITVNRVTRLRYTTTRFLSSSSEVTDSACPENIVALQVFDGRLFAASGNTLYWSAVGDGRDFTNGSNMEIADPDGDSITGLGILENQLIVFKNNSIHRVKATSDVSIPYRREEVGTGKLRVGCRSAFGFVNISVATSLAESLGGSNFLMFVGPNSVYALGTAGSPIDIGKRISNKILDLDNSLLSKVRVAVISDINSALLFLPDPDDSSVSNEQLVYSLESGGWSTFDYSNITCATNYPYNDRIITILGDSNGDFYKTYYNENTDGKQYATSSKSKYLNLTGAELATWTASTDVNTITGSVGGLTANVTCDIPGTETALYLEKTLGATLDLTNQSFEAYVSSSGPNSESSDVYPVSSTYIRFENGDGNYAVYYTDGISVKYIDEDTVPDTVSGAFDNTNIEKIRFGLVKLASTDSPTLLFGTVSLSTYTGAYTGKWKGKYFDFDAPNRYKQIFNTKVKYAVTTTDCPITIKLYDELGNTETDQISTTDSTGLTIKDSEVESTMYSMNTAYEFYNDQAQQSMTIYGWFTEVKGSGNKET